MMSLLSLRNCFANYGMILGNWLEDNGWCSAITEAEVTYTMKLIFYLVRICLVYDTLIK